MARYRAIPVKRVGIQAIQMDVWGVESVRLVRDRTDREDHRAGVRARALRLINASLTGILFCFFRPPFF